VRISARKAADAMSVTNIWPRNMVGTIAVIGCEHEETRIELWAVELRFASALYASNCVTSVSVSCC
jgi:hypothetical protein